MAPKNLILICLIFFGIKSFSQVPKADTIFTDSAFYKNGQLHYIIDAGYYSNEYKMNGQYIEYFETGIVMIEGNYAIKTDSLDCLDCFTIQSDSSLQRILKSEFNESRVGLWKYYYPNGQLKEQGEYSDKIRQTRTEGLFSPKTRHQGDWRSPIGIGPEYLKHGPWEYYDENGFLIEVVWYYEGRIVKKQIAPRPK